MVSDTDPSCTVRHTFNKNWSRDEFDRFCTCYCIKLINFLPDSSDSNSLDEGLLLPMQIMHDNTRTVFSCDDVNKSPTWKFMKGHGRFTFVPIRLITPRVNFFPDCYFQFENL